MNKEKIISKKSLTDLESKRNKLSFKASKVESKISKIDERLHILENKKRKLKDSIFSINAYTIPSLNYDLSQKEKGAVYVQYFRLNGSYTKYKRYLNKEVK